MKIIVASDIHGSAYYAKKLLEQFALLQGDSLILLGDIYYHGPRNPLPKDYAPLEVAALLNTVTDKLTVVKGNCDSAVDNLISDFEFCDMLKLYISGKIITCTHGDKYDKEHLPKGCGDVLIYGHYHTGFITKTGQTICVNTGSVSLPKGGTPASFVIMDEEYIKLVDIEGKVLQEVKYV